MVEKANITNEEFERLRQQPRSKWGELIASLKASDPSDHFEVALDADENNGTGRDRARQSIYSLARYHGMRVRFSTISGVLWVQKSEAAE